MDIKTVYLSVVAAVIVAVSLSIYFLAGHFGGSSGGSLKMTFSSNGETTGTSSVTATYNLQVILVNPTSINENSLSLSLNSVILHKLTGSFTLSFYSNGLKTVSSGHPVVWLSNAVGGTGYAVFFASSGPATISKGDVLDVMYGNIQISSGTITINPVPTSTWSNVTIGMSYSGYSGSESFKL
ncbi:MAG: hypothetical protein M1433_01630 [Candidatus Parvarchaeota archaeon]|nr:hypothetical protein [Candidatus Parvarchaeota archaeon]